MEEQQETEKKNRGMDLRGEREGEREIVVVVVDLVIGCPILVILGQIFYKPMKYLNKLTSLTTLSNNARF